MLSLFLPTRRFQREFEELEAEAQASAAAVLSGLDFTQVSQPLTFAAQCGIMQALPHTQAFDWEKFFRVVYAALQSIKALLDKETPNWMKKIPWVRFVFILPQVALFVISLLKGLAAGWEKTAA